MVTGRNDGSLEERAIIMRNLTLLNPGPVNVSEKVRQALLIPDICHREEEFSQLLQQVRSKILRVLNLNSGYSATILTGSGTAALEAGILAACYAVSISPRLLVLSNGIYGDRIAETARRHKIPTIIFSASCQSRFDAARLDNFLKRNRSIHTVAMVHHETSTGMLNPVSEMGRVVKQHHKIFAVDAISSLGADPLELEEAGVDFCIGTAGKCFHAFPGLSFVIARRQLLQKLARKKLPSLYFDLGSTWKLQEQGDTPFTPAVQLFAAFNAALDEFLKETLEGRIHVYHQRSLFLRDGFEELGLKYLIPRSFYSNTLTSLMFPKGFSYEKLHDLLKKEGFVIYAGQNQFRHQMFRIAHMGQISHSELDRLLKSLSRILRKVKQ